MKHFHVTYTLRNRTRAGLHMVARSSCAAVLQMLDVFGEQLLAVTARPAHPATPATPPRSTHP